MSDEVKPVLWAYVCHLFSVLWSCSLKSLSWLLAKDGSRSKPKWFL